LLVTNRPTPPASYYPRRILLVPGRRRQDVGALPATLAAIGVSGLVIALGITGRADSSGTRRTYDTRVGRRARATRRAPFAV